MTKLISKISIFICILTFLIVVYKNPIHKDDGPKFNADTWLGYDKVSFGNEYFQESLEPIIWYVVDETAEKELLVSQNVMYMLACQSQFDSFKDFDMRHNLNYDAYYGFFNEYERSLILPTRVKYENLKTRDPEYYTDFIFMLSKEEIEKYFDNEVLRVTYPTERAKTMGMYKDTYTSSYWLRTLGKTKSDLMVVNPLGHILENGYCNQTYFIGCRMALWRRKVK